MLTRSFLWTAVGKLQSLMLKLRLVPGSRKITYLKYALKMQKIASLAHLPVPKGAIRGVKRDEALKDLPHLLTIKSTRTQTRSEQEKRSARAQS